MAPIGTASDIDDLKRKCPGALADTELVNIVQKAPLNNNGKINLSWIDREAEKYLRKNLSSSQTIENLRKETRVLAKFCRDHAEEFEKLIAQEKQPEPEKKLIERKKQFDEIEFELPYGTQVTIKEISGSQHHSYRYFFLRFCYADHNENTVIRFCLEILNAILENPTLLNYQDVKTQIEDGLIKLLEEKFGLKVKVCGNCKYYVLETGHCSCSAIDGIRRPIFSDPDRIAIPRQFNNKCIMSESKWTPKETSEKPSSV